MKLVIMFTNQSRALRLSLPLTWMLIVMDWIISVMYANQSLDVLVGF